jgi:hypothetical protein
VATKRQAKKGATAGAKKRARKPPAHLPEPRGRRGHKAVDENPALNKWLREALQRRPVPTLDALVNESKACGFAIGRTAIWDFRVAFEAEQERKQLVLDLAKEYNSSSADGQVLDIETAIATLASARIFQELLDKSSMDAESRELLELFRKLQSSSSQRERTRMYVDRGIRATALRIRAEMQQLLKKDPDTLRRVLAVIDQAAAEVRE